MGSAHSQDSINRRRPMDLGPSCPIPDRSGNNPACDELDMTAQEIEWRRWAEWQKQKSGRQFLKSLNYVP